MKTAEGPTASLAEACDDRLPAMLDDLRRIVECESPSDYLEAVRASADVVADVLGAVLGRAGLAAEPERLEIDGVAHLRWRCRAAGSAGAGTRVLLLGHHDTVWPLGTLDRLPFAVERGVVTGPGCFDMAVGLVMAAHAVAAIADLSGADAVDGVTLLVTGDEEIGSRTSRALLEEEARGADAVLVLEASGPGGAVKTARKGVSLYTLTVHGRAAHAGLDPERGVNAALGIARVIDQVHTLAVAETTTAAGTTVTPTSGRIGTTVNTVPAVASIDVDVRAWTAAEQRRIDASMRALEPGVEGARLEVTGGINRPPLEQAMSAGLAERARALAPLVGVHGYAECAVGGASDGNFTASVGAPTLDGLGGVGGGAHADDEHVLVEHIAPRTALLAALISATGGRT